MKELEQLYQVAMERGMPFYYYQHEKYIEAFAYSNKQRKHFGVRVLDDNRKYTRYGEQIDLPLQDFELYLNAFIENEENDNVK